MADDKETQRLLGFAREHARAALAKAETQRESYLAFCRLNWKRYATSISRNAAEAERFANALDRATRDIMDAMQDAAAKEQEEQRSPWYPLRDDAVEGALDSVTVYEAAIEPELPPEPEPELSESVRSELAIAEELYRQDQERLHSPLPAPVEHAAARDAEEEDRLNARFGFSGTTPREDPTTHPVIEADPELKRKVRELLRARMAAAKPDGES
jgi:hypothetical protein